MRAYVCARVCMVYVSVCMLEGAYNMGADCNCIILFFELQIHTRKCILSKIVLSHLVSDGAAKRRYVIFVLIHNI